MAESQKYGRYVGGHFGWQCIINLEECPRAVVMNNRKPACKSCKVAREYKKTGIQDNINMEESK